MLTELDWELEKRGHRFVRYADDCNIYVGSQRAAERVLASTQRFVEKRLRLKVNEEKSAVDLATRRQFLLDRGKELCRIRRFQGSATLFTLTGERIVGATGSSLTGTTLTGREQRAGHGRDDLLDLSVTSYE